MNNHQLPDTASLSEAPPAPVPLLVRALVTNPRRRIRWAFPALDGLDQATVRAEIAARLGGEYAPILNEPETQVIYPEGAWVGALQQTPLGASTVEPPRPAPAAQATETGLPKHPGEPTGDRGAALDLEGLLSTWRARHGITSAEYYFHLSKALTQHAHRLVDFERHQSQQKEAPRA